MQIRLFASITRPLSVCLALAALLLVAGCGETGTSFDPTQTPVILGSRNVVPSTLDLTETWRFRTGAPNTDSNMQMPAPIFITKDKVVISSLVDNERNYGNASVLTALSLADGRILWQTKFDNPGFGTSIVSAYLNTKTDRLFLLNLFRVAAFDLDTGRQLWITPDLGGHTAYVFALEQGDENLSVDSSYSERITIDPSNGQVLSRLKTGQGIMTIIHGNVKLVNSESSFSGMDQNDRLLWTWRDARRKAEFWPSFVGENDVIAEFGGPSYYLARLNDQSGQEVWSTSFDIVSNYAVLGSRVFVLRESGVLSERVRVLKSDATENASLIALDLETGSVVGTMQFDKVFLPDVGKAPFWVAVNDPYLFTYFGDTQELVAFKFEGK